MCGAYPVLGVTPGSTPPSPKNILTPTEPPHWSKFPCHFPLKTQYNNTGCSGLKEAFLAFLFLLTKQIIKDLFEQVLLLFSYCCSSSTVCSRPSWIFLKGLRECALTINHKLWSTGRAWSHTHLRQTLIIRFVPQKLTLGHWNLSSGNASARTKWWPNYLGNLMVS